MQKQPVCPYQDVTLSACAPERLFLSGSMLQIMHLIIPQERRNPNELTTFVGVVCFGLSMSSCLFFFFFMYVHILPLFCFGTVAHSTFSAGMEIWHFDRLLLFQKMTSVVFKPLDNILLSWMLPAWVPLCGAAAAGAWVCAQHTSCLQAQLRTSLASSAFIFPLSRGSVWLSFPGC